MSVPPEAITAAAEAMRKAACTLPQVEFGTPLTTLAKAALEAAAPLIADAQRDAFWRDVLGFKIGERVYAPEDVTIIRREEP